MNVQNLSKFLKAFSGNRYFLLSVKMFPTLQCWRLVLWVHLLVAEGQHTPAVVSSTSQHARQFSESKLSLHVSLAGCLINCRPFACRLINWVTDSSLRLSVKRPHVWSCKHDSYVHQSSSDSSTDCRLNISHTTTDCICRLPDWCWRSY